MFSIRVYESHEPIVLWGKKNKTKQNKNDGFPMILKAFPRETNLWVTLGTFAVKIQNFERKLLKSEAKRTGPYFWIILGNKRELRGYPFFSSNLWSKFSQCYYIVTRECHISPESLCCDLSKFTHYFDLVSMATLLALWLVEHGNGRNSKMKHRFDKIFGTDAK